MTRDERHSTDRPAVDAHPIPIDVLIDRSSLGTGPARAVAARTPSDRAQRVAHRARQPTGDVTGDPEHHPARDLGMSVDDLMIHVITLIRLR